MTVPDWWQALLLAAAAWRTWRLLADDDILDRPRRYVTRMNKDWETAGTGPDYRDGLARWLSCPYCAGFWTALAWWIFWQAWDHGTLVVATILALNTGLILVEKFASSEQ